MAIIQQAILRIYDISTHQGILSAKPLDLSVTVLQKYIESMIDKVRLTTKRRQGQFALDHARYLELKALQYDFVDQSQRLTQVLILTN